jgi:hypothetical protein
LEAKQMTNPFLKFSSLALVFSLLLIVARMAGAQDIMCMSKKDTPSFSVPAECLKVCYRGGLGKFVHCALPKKAKCTGFDDPVFASFYNCAVLGTACGQAAIAGASKDTLIAHTISHFFKPNNIKDFNFKWGPPENTTNWAKVEPAGSGAQKMSLVVAPDAISRSPAAFVITLGHEMIHVEQLKRKLKTRMDGLSDVASALRELEAYAWERGVTGFPWEIGANKWATCTTEAEKAESVGFEACYEWKAKHAIESVRDGPLNYRFLGFLEKYLNEEPWASQVWLKAHPDWKTFKVGPRPAGC